MNCSSFILCLPTLALKLTTSHLGNLLNSGVQAPTQDKSEDLGDVMSVYFKVPQAIIIGSQISEANQSSAFLT